MTAGLFLNIRLFYYGRREYEANFEKVFRID